RSYGWDSIEPGGTDYFMNTRGERGICVECGYNLDPEAPKRAIQSIKIFLSVMGLTDEPIPAPTQNQQTLRAYFIYHTKNDFVPVRTFADFEELKTGEVIGTDGSEKIFAPVEKNVIIFCRKREEANQEAFILARETIYF
ncbi:MAG TPA: hypothetical protein VJH75_04720, partial [Patescibacteria group bacterium]|nr:hypothetical protein [Patescibacteria group bacterium]